MIYLILWLDSMVKGSKRRYLWIIPIALLLYLLFLILNGQVPPPQRMTYSTVAVINDTTSQIVWVGGSGLCIPAAPNTHLVFNCESQGNGYECNGTSYVLSNVQISC